MIGHIVNFGIGVVLAVAFALGGVTKPGTIVGFLDFAGDWKPAVMLVMGGALTVTFIAYRLIFRRERPLLAPKFYVPTRRDIDARLVVGAALFGAGWGLIGLCPGPALASLTSGTPELYLWFAALVGGMYLFRVWDGAMAARAARAAHTAAPKVETESTNRIQTAEAA